MKIVRDKIETQKKFKKAKRDIAMIMIAAKMKILRFWRRKLKAKGGKI
jgi:hypothetical protein